MYVPCTSNHKMAWITGSLGDKQFTRQTVITEDEEHSRNLSKTPPRKKSCRPRDAANWSDGQASELDTNTCSRSHIVPRRATSCFQKTSGRFFVDISNTVWPHKEERSLGIPLEHRVVSVSQWKQERTHNAKHTSKAMITLQRSEGSLHHFLCT